MNAFLLHMTDHLGNRRQWLRVHLRGSEFSSAVQERFQRKVVELTKGDLTASVIALCANAERLTAYNLAVRLVEVGHTNVYWYRGGLKAGEQAICHAMI